MDLTQKQLQHICACIKITLDTMKDERTGECPNLLKDYSKECEDLLEIMEGEFLLKGGQIYDE